MAPKLATITCLRPPILPRRRIILRFSSSYGPNTFRRIKTNPEYQEEPSQTLEEIEEALATPTWSVKSLLPSAADVESGAEIDKAKLHHLLRLSALPSPANEEQESQMLKDLRAQLHFVKQIQEVDTQGVEPLKAIRDQSAMKVAEDTITLESMRDSLAREEVVGQYHRRIQRKKEVKPETEGSEDWDPLAHAKKTVGRFFVVDRDD